MPCDPPTWLLKGHYRFIKKHNEHCSHHHSQLLASFQDGGEGGEWGGRGKRKKNKKYRPNKNTTAVSASCRDASSQHISPLSYYSWQLTLSLNPALLPCCFTPSSPSTFIFYSPSLSLSRSEPPHTRAHTHTHASTHKRVRVSHRCLMWRWWLPIRAVHCFDLGYFFPLKLNVKLTEQTKLGEYFFWAASKLYANWGRCSES